MMISQVLSDRGKSRRAQRRESLWSPLASQPPRQINKATAAIQAAYRPSGHRRAVRHVGIAVQRGANAF